MTILLIGKSSTISQQLAALQEKLRGVVPSGPTIRWDGRKDVHEDFLAEKDWELSERHARNVLNGDV